KLKLTAYGRSGLVASIPAQLELEGAATSEAPTLHLLAVGISAYQDRTLQQGVRFAAGDATAFRNALMAAGRAPTTRVAEPVLLTDAQATGDGIRAALRAMAGRVRRGDLFVLYMAGHGTATIQGDYTFLPQDLKYRNSDSLREGLGGEELRTLLSRINSNKTVVVLDTCSSGKFSLPGRSLGEKGAIDRLALLTGQVVFAATGDERMALESPDSKRGIYTGALLRALAGQADVDRDGMVGVREAADYVEKEVSRISKQLFGYEQTPMFNGKGQNFPFSRSGQR
ncbi:MAG: caspase domain-containing protein, partial [Cyanobium sp.]